MEALWNVIGKINTALWSNPMLFLALGSGLIFTICLRFVQVRKLKTMVGLLFNGKASDHGLSSFQAFTLAIAGRVGTGNIVGVATAICAGGPGALFWMWMIAIVGSATTFVECTLSQLHKKKIDGEYKGGWVYYIGDKWKVIGGICSVLFIATLAFTQTLVHSNAMSTALTNAFGIPPIVCGIVIAVILGAIVFGGVKVIARVAEIVVPVMSVIYVLVALVILAVNYQNIPAAFALIFKSAFGADQIIGAAMGSAMIWGTKRAIFSSETGMATATPSTEVSHPAKQGLVQAFSVYIDTLFVCTATGLMLIITGCYSVQGADGSFLFTGMGQVGADATLGAGRCKHPAALRLPVRGRCAVLLRLHHHSEPVLQHRLLRVLLLRGQGPRAQVGHQGLLRCVLSGCGLWLRHRRQPRLGPGRYRPGPDRVDQLPVPAAELPRGHQAAARLREPAEAGRRPRIRPRQVQGRQGLRACGSEPVARDPR